jgi:hypothetical protein
MAPKETIMTIMLTRKAPVTALAAVLLALASASLGAEQMPTHDMRHMPIDQQVEMAHTRQEHDAVAERLEQEASEFEKRAGEHERLGKLYRGGFGGPKKNGAALANHCDKLVKNLRASAQETREMARLHRHAAQQLDE